MLNTALLLVIATNLVAIAVVATPPNIVVLFLDDFGWGDLGANNPETTETPNMDRLAAESLRFTDFHASASFCTPSRAGLLTGRLGIRTGVTANFAPNSLFGMALGEVTMADVLGTAGYQNHMIGKWHLGHNAPYHPTYRGFETFFGLPYSGDMGCLDTTPQSCEPSFNRTSGEPACPALCPSTGSNPLNLVAVPLYDSTGVNCSGQACNLDIVEQPFNPFLLNTRYGDRAVSIIQAAATTASAAAGNSTKPLFLYVAFAHTHTPLAYAPQWTNASSRPGMLRVFGNTLAELDDAVGRIVKAVDDAGLRNNTVIVLAADNGPADLASVACEAIGSSGPFVGAWQHNVKQGGGGATSKGTTWEGGHRVAGLLRWPGTVAPGVSDVLSSTLDLLPTFAALANVSLPRDRHYDGIDLSPVLFSSRPFAVDRTLFHQDANGDINTVRSGNLKAFFATAPQEACRKPDGTHGPTGKPMNHTPPLVFDVSLSADPAEKTPLPVNASLAVEFVALRARKLHDVSSSLVSVTNYSLGDKTSWPCCNTNSPACQCAWP